MNKWFIGLALLLFATSNVWSYNHGVYIESLRAEAIASAQTATNATATTQAGVVERHVEQAAQAAVNEVTQYAVVDQTQLAAALAIANGTVDRLQSEFKTTRNNLSGAGSYSSLAERSASATRAAMVLSDLLGSCQRRVVEVTGRYQDARQRGLNCSTSYDKVSKVFADGG
jgi:hypothetical protein